MKRIVGGTLLSMVVGTLSACTVGSPGPCNGCIDSASLAPGAITATSLQDGSVRTAALAAKSVTGAIIADNTITGANIDTGTILTASGYSFTTAQLRAVYASPTTCQRADSSALPYQDVAVLHPNALGSGNAIGPSVKISNVAAGRYTFYCPVQIHAPLGATVRVVGGALAYFDGSASCLVGAAMVTKAVSSWDNGTILSTVYDGATATDFAFTGGPQPPGPTGPVPVTKGFPGFAAVTLTAGSELFLNAFITNDSTATGGDCRYSGAFIFYTVDKL